MTDLSLHRCLVETGMGLFDGLFRKRGPRADYERLIARGLKEVEESDEANERMWRLRDAEWRVNQDDGVILFRRPDGAVAQAAVQVVGTYDPGSGKWRWAWNHPRVARRLAEHAAFVRTWGEENGIDELTTVELAADERACRRFCGLTLELNRAQGVFRGCTDTTNVYMTVGAITPVGDDMEAWV